MKSSQPLLVKTTHTQKEEDIIIHPNAGYDLGLMNTRASVKIFNNATIEIFNCGDKDFMEGLLILENKCTHGTIQLNSKYWKKLGSPERIVLFFDENKLLLSNTL